MAIPMKLILNHTGYEAYLWEDLIGHFDVLSVLEAWRDGRLERWLKRNQEKGEFVLGLLSKLPLETSVYVASIWLINAFFAGKPTDAVKHQLDAIFPESSETSSLLGTPVVLPRDTVTLSGGVLMDLIWCPPGCFWMGSPDEEVDRAADETRHQVTLSKGFWIGKYEVTQKHWQAVMGTISGKFSGDDLPVERVSWDDCQEFCRRLNKQVTGGGFRLPVEAEWEYACRAGTQTTFCYGNNLDSTMANFGGKFPYGSEKKGTARETSTVVGTFAPNAWGLYDMHGNVWEWCQDWFGDYPAEPIVDPVGVPSGVGRVGRGGGWQHGAQFCRAACRGQGAPSIRLKSIGFRLARTEKWGGHAIV